MARLAASRAGASAWTKGAKLAMGDDGMEGEAVPGNRTRENIKNWRPRAGAASLVVLAVIALAVAARPARSESPAPQASKTDCQRSAFRIVLDVGHTVDSPGADSARGVPEYQFNLALADVIKDSLVKAGFDNTVRMITTTMHVAGLVERAVRANAMHADLFIALHHDSVPDNLIENWEYEGQPHHFSDRFSGYSIFVSNENGDPKGSLAFGHLLGLALQARGLHYTPHYTLPLMGRHRRDLLDAEAGVYRFDLLVVLRETRMPAVLLEAGSIVNRRDELELATSERRALVAAGVTAAVEDFCAMRAQPTAEARIKPQPPSASTPGHRRPAALAH
jgi:N-acetylmuramoyl-L-alanine amidase